MPEIQEIGSYAGFAAIVGLAVLSALYFSQARDVKRLREWAGRAPERADGTPAAVPGRMATPPAQPQQPAPGRPAAPPVPGQPAPARAVASGAAPAAATAAGQATPNGQNSDAPTAAPVAGEPSGEVKVAKTKPEEAASEKEEEKATAGDTAESAAPAAAAAATPAGQRGPGAPSVPPRGAAAPGRPAAPRRPVAPNRPALGQTAIIPPPREPWYRRAVGNPRYVVLIVAGVLIVGGGAYFAVDQLGGDEGGTSGGGQAGSSGAPAAEEGSGQDDGDPARLERGGAVRPGDVTVAVLNGTTVPGLAATLSDEVGAAGFQVGTITNFSDQQLAESIVQFTPGHEREAQEVSRRLGISQREPVNPSTQGLAGDATVIVIAGSDKAQ